jgi:hypothetical protein
MTDASRPWTQTLAGRLAPLTARLRGLHAQFGTRTHRVFLVWVRWSGMQRGDGVPNVERELELAPPPLVRENGSLPFRFLASGAAKAGDVYLEEIGLVHPDGTPLTQEQLTGVEPYGGRMPPNVDFFYELRPVTPGEPPMRYTLAGEPGRDNASLQWTCLLAHRDPDTTRDGPTAATVTY